SPRRSVSPSPVAFQPRSLHFHLFYLISAVPAVYPGAPTVLPFPDFASLLQPPPPSFSTPSPETGSGPARPSPRRHRARRGEEAPSPPAAAPPCLTRWWPLARGVQSVGWRLGGPALPAGGAALARAEEPQLGARPPPKPRTDLSPPLSRSCGSISRPLVWDSGLHSIPPPGDGGLL
ncbi:hypothetical protein MC885_009471, partial [Smutsia gigantea]